MLDKAGAGFTYIGKLGNLMGHYKGKLYQFVQEPTPFDKEGLLAEAVCKANKMGLAIRFLTKKGVAAVFPSEFQRSCTPQ